MSEDIRRGLHQGVFHCVRNCIHTKGKYTYRVNFVNQNELQKGEIFDESRLKKRLLREIVARNKARANKYPKANVAQISEDIPFRISTFYSEDDKGSSSAGRYGLFPLEFICKTCGKVYTSKTSKELKDIPKKCENCGGSLEQNTIVLYCEECGTISSMNLWCSTDGHGSKYAHLDRKTKDDISTWRAFCLKCKTSGFKNDIDFLRYGCPKCNSKRRPLTVREGGVYTPVIKTFIDLQQKPTGEHSDSIRMAVESKLITLEGIESRLPESKRGKVSDILDLIDSVRRNGADPLGSEEYKAANDYITHAVNQIQRDYKGVDLDDLNDVRYVRDTSKSFDQYLQSLSGDESEQLMEWYANAKDKFGLFEIRYAEQLKVIRASIGQIIGVNKFYEDDFIPHFEPFRENMKSKEIYAMVAPMMTEGILFRLNPIRVCNWLYKNNLTDVKIDTVKDAISHIAHLVTDSKEYNALKTLVHTYSHILIKQSSIFTGLDENSCAELIFPTDASFMIYSTSNINIGGFEYAFNYSLPNWFSRIEEAAEDCTFDPSCMKEGGRCFSCIHVAEFVCCNFNKDLSRQTLVGRQSVKEGYLYGCGFWK